MRASIRGANGSTERRRCSLTARRDPISSLVLTLAEPLTVRSVTSTRHGYLMALRVSGQDDIIINLPEPLRPDELLDLEFVYGGRLPAIPPEREAIEVRTVRVTSRRTISSTFRRFRATSTPADRAGIRRERSPTTRRRRCGFACPKGIRRSRADRWTRDIRKRCRPKGARSWVEYRFSATQPVRYLGWATSRFVHVDSASFSIAAAEEDDAPLTGASYTFGEITVESSGMLQRRGRELFDETQRVMKFYGSVLSDIPYPSFTLAVVEREQPGGHSPPYFATLSHPPPATPISWRTRSSVLRRVSRVLSRARDRASMVGAGGRLEELPRAVDQRGVRAVLRRDVRRAREERAASSAQVIAQMARWTLDRSDQGPVYLGYRLGHIRNDGRVFRALVYNKGALTLHMLRKLIGDDAFFRGLAALLLDVAVQEGRHGRSEGRVRDRGEPRSRRVLRSLDIRIVAAALEVQLHHRAGAVVVRFEQIGERFEVPVTVTLKHAASSTDVTIPVTEQVTTQRIPVTGPVRGVGVNEDDAAPVVFVQIKTFRNRIEQRMDTVKVTINGRELTVEKGKTVLQAAIENGIELPYYCYHPGLGVDGSCRVCIVKIEKMPKLQTSCSTVCTDGMIVHTQTPDVVEARAGVFEFLLINHPLDCPVCDKGGECPLQDFSYEFGPDRSRMEFPRRTFDGEGVEADVDFGPTLMLNRNRCILCTRCIRFMRDVDGDAQIGVTDRGAGSEISTYKEEGVHSLLSGNLMDVCPVGAITTRDYRFKSRPWDNPLAGDTICTFCSKGCNTTVWIKAKPEWARGAQMARVTPRFNPEINSYWMCDIGRFDYHWVESDRRLVQPLVRRVEGRAAARQLARRVARASRARRRTRERDFTILTSAHASLEELHVLKQLAKGVGAPISVELHRH